MSKSFDVPQQEVLIASGNTEQIARIRRALEMVFEERNVPVAWHEATSVRGALNVLGQMEMSFAPLVVMAGFEGQWYEVLGRAEEIAWQEIITIMMTGDPVDAAQVKEFGMHPISTMLSEKEMAMLAASLLFDERGGTNSAEQPAVYDIDIA